MKGPENDVDVQIPVALRDCTFEDNIATDPPSRPYGSTGTHHGGAVMNIEGTVVARNTSFVRGNAHQGGALYTWMWGFLDVAGCSFVNNTAIGASHNTGGAIFGWSASGSCKNETGPTICQNVTLDRCDFRQNRAIKQGGAVGNQWSAFALNECTCEGNAPQDLWIDGATKSPTNISGGTCRA